MKMFNTINFIQTENYRPQTKLRKGNVFTHVWQVGMHGRGVVHGRGHVWQRVCMAGSVHGREACVAGGMHREGGGGVW